MKIRTVRAGGALIVGALITPLGIGLAVAETEPPATGTVETVEAEGTGTTDPAASAADGADAGTAEDVPDAQDVTEEVVGDPAEGAAAQDDLTQDDQAQGVPAQGGAAAEAATTAGAAVDVPLAASADLPAGVLITSLTLDASVSPLTQPWVSTGGYTVTVTVLDVVGGGSDGNSYPGLMDGTTFTYRVNGGDAVPVVPAADGSFVVSGLREGTNTLVVDAQYLNPDQPAVWGAASYFQQPVVLERDTVIDVVREDTLGAGGYEETRYQGESVTLVAPAGTYAPGEQLTVLVLDNSNTVVDRVTVPAAADGSLEFTYQVPAGMTPGDYLLYLENADGPAGSFILHVLEVPAVAPVPTPVATPDPGVTVNVSTTVTSSGTATLTDRLATTGSETSAGLLAGTAATVLGAGLAGGAAVLRRRSAASRG